MLQERYVAHRFEDEPSHDESSVHDHEGVSSQGRAPPYHWNFPNIPHQQKDLPSNLRDKRRLQLWTTTPVQIA